MELMQHDGTVQLVKVTLDSGESLEATAGHPFYVPGKGWNVAANLKVGDVLRLHNGVTLVIKTVETSTRFAKVYNFAVAQNANYFVGEDGVLVHNVSGPKGKCFRGGKKKDRDNWYGHNDKDFQKWWHREGKEEFNGGMDIENTTNAQEAFDYWVSIGRPKVK